MTRLISSHVCCFEVVMVSLQVSVDTTYYQLHTC